MSRGSWPFRNGRTVAVSVYIQNDRTGERTADPDRTTVIEGCAFDPGTTSATVANGVTVEQQPRLFGPFDIDVEPHLTTVLIDGDDYEVDGVALRWRNDITGREACAEVPLTRTKGPRR